MSKFQKIDQMGRSLAEKGWVWDRCLCPRNLHRCYLYGFQYILEHLQCSPRKNMTKRLKKSAKFCIVRNFSSYFIYKIFYELSRSMKPFLTHKEIIRGYFLDIFTQFQFIPFALESPPMEQFSPKFSNGDYVIRDDVIGYPDKSTDSSWPNEQSGITSFYELWDRKSRISLMRVPLKLDIFRFFKGSLLKLCQR